MISAFLHIAESYCWGAFAAFLKVNTVPAGTALRTCWNGIAHLPERYCAPAGTALCVPVWLGYFLD
jgi:hypothetical protein